MINEILPVLSLVPELRPTINGIVNLDIKRISKICNENARDKGFWDQHDNIMEKLFKNSDITSEEEKAVQEAFANQRIVLMVSELGEAVEASRKNLKANRFEFIDHINQLASNGELTKETFQATFQGYIKDSKEDEMADTLIRIFECSHGEDMDIDFFVKMKMLYNSLRPRLHGKEY